MHYSNKNNEKIKKQGFLRGLVYGLIPHIGCIAFILFSILGVTAATSFFKPLLLNPYFFYILMGLSFVFATASALFYFKRQGFITLSRMSNGIEISFLPGGLKRKWKYLLTLYGTTIFINLLLFMVIFPIAANINSGTSLTAAVINAFGGNEKTPLSDSVSLIALQVAIPCPGHAPLIIGELKGIDGVESVKFKFPNLFDVGYDPEKTSKQQILSLDVFDTYKGTVMNEEAEADGIQLVDDTEQSQPLINTGSCCGGGSGSRGCGCGRVGCGSQ